MAGHWSFILCDRKYLYPVVILLLALGLSAAVTFKEASHFNRAGNFIMAVGVWMSMSTDRHLLLVLRLEDRASRAGALVRCRKRHVVVPTSRSRVFVMI